MNHREIKVIHDGPLFKNSSWRLESNCSLYLCTRESLETMQRVIHYFCLYFYLIDIFLTVYRSITTLWLKPLCKNVKLTLCS